MLLIELELFLRVELFVVAELLFELIELGFEVAQFILGFEGGQGKGDEEAPDDDGEGNDGKAKVAAQEVGEIDKQAGKGLVDGGKHVFFVLKWWIIGRRKRGNYR